MMARAYLRHHITGRTRVQVPAIKDDPEACERLRHALASRPGIEQVRVNPLTGSVLIHHTADLSTLVSSARDEELFDLVSAMSESEENGAATHAPRSPEHPIEVARRGLVWLGDRLQVETKGAVNLRTVGFLTLIGLGVTQTVRGNLLGPASGFFMAALGTLAVTDGRIGALEGEGGEG